MSREVKQVSFGQKDSDMLLFLGDKGQFSKYVKQLIKAEMEREELSKLPKKIEVKASVEDKIDEILELLKSGKISLSNDDTPEDVKEDELTITEAQKSALMNTMSAFNIKKH